MSDGDKYAWREKHEEEKAMGPKRRMEAIAQAVEETGKIPVPEERFKGIWGFPEIAIRSLTD